MMFAFMSCRIQTSARHGGLMINAYKQLFPDQYEPGKKDDQPPAASRRLFTLHDPNQQITSNGIRLGKDNGFFIH